jgi:hypothetical protein
VTAGLPDFLVVGAPKSGTTSLYRYLEGHPDVYLSPVKEPRYFAFPDAPPRFVGPGAKDLNREIVWREEDYRALFAGRQPHHRAGGEASATYLWAPGAAERIARTVPESRLIAILRQPADRAFSHFWHNRARHREPLASFEDALAAEPERRRRHYSFNLYYAERGLYGAQLARYLQLFPREQVLVLLFEDFVRDPVDVMARVATHIGVDAEFSFDSTVRHNPRRGRVRFPRVRRLVTSERVVKSRLRAVVPRPLRRTLLRVGRSTVEAPERLDPELRARLTKRFEEDIHQLEDLLGRDVSHWLRTDPGDAYR